MRAAPDMLRTTLGISATCRVRRPAARTAAAVLLAGCCTLAAGVGGVAAAEPPRLPGARPVIEAINYPSLQAAIDAAGPQGGLVRLPPGTFDLAAPLIITCDDLHLEGAGTATVLRNVSESGQSTLAIRPPAAPDDKRARIWRVEVSNLRLVGNPKCGHGIDALQVNEVFLHGVTVTGHGGAGVRLDNCYEDPRINDCLITYNAQAGAELLGCHDIVVSGCHFEENQDAVVCRDGFNLCMSGNNLDDHLRHGVVIENTYGSIVSANMIEECQGVGIRLDRDCYGITLSANVIAHEFSGGIELLDAHGIAVTGNTFPLVWKNALYIGPESGRVTVSGNAFSDSAIGGGERKREADQEPASGIVLEGTREINITGNTFSGLTTKALELRGEPSRGCLFSHNLLVGVASDHARLVESQVEGNVERP